MIYFFYVPLWIIFILILFALAGVKIITDNIVYIFFVIMQIILIFIGIRVVKKMFSEIKRTNRVYMCIPAILFLIFSFLGLFVCYECLCMSESYIEVTSAYYTYLEQIVHRQKQTYHVRIYAILLCCVMAGVFIKLYPIAFEQERKKSKIRCLLCTLVIILPILTLFHVCNKQYYDKNAVYYESVCKLKEDVHFLWKDINNSERSEICYIEIPIPYKIKAGEVIYLTGEEMTMDGIPYVEIFIREKNVIGYIPREKVQ